MLPVGNQGGFRYKGSVQGDDIRLVVLYTSGEHPDWPDRVDPFTGTLTYFGDNRRPGQELHTTTRQGNTILRRLFERASGGQGARATVPPILLFSKGEHGREVVFRGLAVPAAPGVAPGDDLVAVWRAVGQQRFQNYRATFTILDEAVITRQWIDDALSGTPLTHACPPTWRKWVDKRVFTPLVSERINTRSRKEQLPSSEEGRRILEVLHGYFNVTLEDPVRFEACAVDLWRMSAPNTGEVDLTRPWRDGGRDAVGSYLLGPPADRLAVEFALEAKCYGIGNSVGVREMSRLISRLRYRQFGVFVTTSYFDDQAYKEVRQDQHPVVLLCGRDIVDILALGGMTKHKEVEKWMKARYPGSE